MGETYEAVANQFIAALKTHGRILMPTQRSQSLLLHLAEELAFAAEIVVQITPTFSGGAELAIYRTSVSKKRYFNSKENSDWLGKSVEAYLQIYKKLAKNQELRQIRNAEIAGMNIPSGMSLLRNEDGTC